MQGWAYLFSTNGAWLTTFTNPTPAASDWFGTSVAAVGTDLVLIGAAWDNTGAADAGAAYLFGTNGALLTTFTNPTPSADDSFGYSVAAFGTDRVLIGAYLDDADAGAAGAAYLFSTNGTLLTTFTNPTPAAIDWFGHSVAAVGTDQVLIGAYADDTGARNAGAAYLFSTNGVLLTTFANPNPAVDDFFSGCVTAVGTERVLIGAHSDDMGASDAGAAYLFSLETFTPGLVADGVNARSITTASLEDGAVTAAKIGGVLFASQIPDMGASKITSGTMADARLSTNVALLNRSPQSFTGGTNVFTGRVGVGITNPATALDVNGTVTASNFVGTLGANQLTGTISSNNIGAGSITTASLEDGAVTPAKLDPTIGVWTRAGNDVLRLAGNVGIGTSSFTSNRLQVAGMVGATAFNTSSDRAAKQDFTAVDAQAVLAKVAALPITQWSFKEFPGALHLGPMAQDFHAAFRLGVDDKSIATVDADGVALAAIQGLNEKVEVGGQSSAARIQKLEAENAELKQRLAELERAIQKLGILETQP